MISVAQKILDNQHISDIFSLLFRDRTRHSVGPEYFIPAFKAIYHEHAMSLGLNLALTSTGVGSRGDILMNYLYQYYSKEVYGEYRTDWIGGPENRAGRDPIWKEQASIFIDMADIPDEQTFIRHLEKNNKEQQMFAIKIEKRTFFNGTDVSTLSDEDICIHIATAEGEIDQLEKIKNKPNALKKRIEDLKAGIDGLVEIVDARTPFTPEGSSAEEHN